MNYIFYTNFRTPGLDTPLKEALARNREDVVIAAPVTIGFLEAGVRAGAEKLLKRLGTDYVDFLMLGWLGVASAWTEGTVGALHRLKEAGLIRGFGVSIHDRPRAGKLAAERAVDLLMIRYNAAHPGAEHDIFPHLGDDGPTVLAYTATAWRKLLQKPKSWDGPPMTAGDCYRFCLSNPQVDVVLTGPANERELDENLNAVAQGPLSEADLARFRAFGKVVHG